MKRLPIVQLVEQFHLLFLDHFGRKAEKNLYALKGGCNLRFFLKSIRYSEDIDIDIQIIRKDTLLNLVNRILKSAPFEIVLRSKGMRIEEVIESKQTETTQRWKIKLSTLDSSAFVNTKIEFSRRGIDELADFGIIDSLILQNYQLTPILVSHYAKESAFKQKVAALALRNETQARDLFDLFHLLNMGVNELLKENIPEEQLKTAIENAQSLTFKEFLGQVVAFLPLDYQEQYTNEELWDNMVLKVTGALSK
ncbi:MAG: nucleotidyl transferase AbiEii/AbiGii toxin family protein [Parachlamydiaceae bacterium]